jgi:hypothetical protein
LAGQSLWAKSQDIRGGTDHVLFPSTQRGRWRGRVSDPGPRGGDHLAAGASSRTSDGIETTFGEANPKAKRVKSDSYVPPAPHGQLWPPTRPLLPAATIAEAPQKLLFACPYYRYDPKKYQNCLGYSLSRIKDVKQHLSRCHKQPDFYCPRCYATFDKAAHRDTHVRSVGCKPLPHSGYTGITEDQKKELQKYEKRGKPLETQWLDVWDILFPLTPGPQPKFVYVGSPLEESILHLRSFWSENGTEILAEASLPPSAHDTMIRYGDNILGAIFDQFERAAGITPIQDREDPDQTSSQKSLFSVPSDGVSGTSFGTSSASRSRHSRKSVTFSIPASAHDSIESPATDKDGDDLWDQCESPSLGRGPGLGPKSSNADRSDFPSSMGCPDPDMGTTQPAIAPDLHISGSPGFEQEYDDFDYFTSFESGHEGEV